MVLKFDKATYRQHCKTDIKKYSQIIAKSKSNVICNKLLKIILNYKCKNILLFTPLKYEPDILKMRSKLSRKYNLFLPLMVDKSLKMVKLRLPFRISKFKVKESLNSIAFNKKLDLLIIPVFGVDKNMARIGHGLGFYDRFIGSFSHKPLIIFVGIKDMFINSKICDFYDVRADFYVTPTKTYIKARHDRSNFEYCSSGYRRSNRIFCSKKN